MNRAPMPPIKLETLAMIERLIGFDTTSRDSNLGLIEWTRDYLKAYGIESRLTYDAAGNKAKRRIIQKAHATMTIRCLKKFRVRHSGEGRNPVFSISWTPAVAGVTNF